MVLPGAGRPQLTANSATGRLSRACDMALLWTQPVTPASAARRARWSAAADGVDSPGRRSRRRAVEHEEPPARSAKVLTGVDGERRSRVFLDASRDRVPSAAAARDELAGN